MPYVPGRDLFRRSSQRHVFAEPDLFCSRWTRLETPAQPARFAQFTELVGVVDSARGVVFLRVEVAPVQVGGCFLRVECAGLRGFVGTREGT